MSEVEWRDIPDFPDYEFSSEQEVRKKSTGRIVQHSTGEVALVRPDGRPTTRNVFKLVRQIYPEVYNAIGKD